MVYRARRRSYSRRPRRTIKTRTRKTTRASKRFKRAVTRVIKSKAETKRIGWDWAQENFIHYGGLSNDGPGDEPRSGILFKNVIGEWRIPQGTSNTERIGQQIEPLGVRFQVQLCAMPFSSSNSMRGPFECHMIVYKDKPLPSMAQHPDSTPQAEVALNPQKIRLRPDSNSTTTQHWTPVAITSERYSQLDLWNTARYTIMKHKVWKFNAPTFSAPASSSDATRVGPSLPLNPVTGVPYTNGMPQQQLLNNPSISANLPNTRTCTFSLAAKKVWKFDSSIRGGYYCTNEKNVAIGFWIVPLFSGPESHLPAAADKPVCITMRSLLRYKDI